MKKFVVFTFYILIGVQLLGQTVEVGSIIQPSSLTVKGLENSPALIWDNGSASLKNAQDALIWNRAKLKFLLDADNNNHFSQSEFSLFSNRMVSDTNIASINFNLDGGNSWIKAGNLGIGTTSPNSDLEVSGPDNTKAIQWDNGMTSLRHHFDLLATQRGWIRFLIDSDNDFENAHFAIYNNKSSSSGIASVRFHLDGGDSWFGSGNVGIGTNSPDEKLEVSGAIKIGDVSSSMFSNGTMRWNGTDFEGHTDQGWVSFTNGWILKDEDGDTAIKLDNGADPDTISFLVDSVQSFLMAANSDGLSEFTFQNNANNVFILSNDENETSFDRNNNIVIGNENGLEIGSDDCILIGQNVGATNSIKHESIVIGLNALSGGTSTPARRVTVIGQEIFIPFSSNLVSAVEGSSAFGRLTALDAQNVIRLGANSIASIGGYASWSTFSDQRFKKEIKNNVPGLEFILKLNPVTYHLDVRALNKYYSSPTKHTNDLFIHQKEQELQTGFLAQEVEAAAVSLGYKFSGVDRPKNEHALYALRYAEFVAPMVKATQQQQQLIDQQSILIDELQNQIALIRVEINNLQKK